MHGRHKILITLGIILCLMPLLAIPYAAKGWTAAVIGALIIGTVLTHARHS